MLKMIKLLFANSVFAVIFITPQAYAHAVITQSSLKIAPVQPGQASRINLQFNAKIESGLSRVFLVSSGDKLTPLKISSGTKPGELIVEVPALESGEYALKIKVFAADGHLTEDLQRFTVTP